LSPPDQISPHDERGVGATLLANARNGWIKPSRYRKSKAHENVITLEGMYLWFVKQLLVQKYPPHPFDGKKTNDEILFRADISEPGSGTEAF
jgi:hypothetical protein